MRILIISTFFPPLNSIASLRAYSWAKYWVKAGHEVTVLTTDKQKNRPTALDVDNPGFQLLEVPQPKLFNRMKHTYQEASKPSMLKKTLLSFFHYLRDRKGIFNACRMPDLTDFWMRRAWKAVKSEKSWDLCVSTSGPYSVHILAYRLKKRGLIKKWIADFRDRWSDNHIYPGLFPFNTIEKFLEERIIQAADAVTTVSEPYGKILAAKYAKVYTIENGFDPSDLHGLSPDSSFLSDGKYRLVHTGSIYTGKQDASPLFRAIQEMRDDPVLDSLDVVFVGTRQGNIEELIERYSVGKWVRKIEEVPRRVALSMQRDAHALLFLPWNDLSVDGVLTGKIFEYLSSKTAIICVGGKGLEASQRLVLESNAGIVLKHVEEIKRFLKEQLTCIKKISGRVDLNRLKRYERKELAMKLLAIAGVVQKQPKKGNSKKRG